MENKALTVCQSETVRSKHKEGDQISSSFVWLPAQREQELSE